MPRKKLLRRFEPRYGVSQAAVEVEAKYLGREVEDYEHSSSAEIESRHGACEKQSRHTWEHLQLLLEGLDEKDLRILEALLFRDVYHIAEVYLAFIRTKHP